jgi:hypothetical protein
VRKVQLTPTARMGHVKVLEKTSCKYPVRRVEVKVDTVPTGNINYVQDNVFGTAAKETRHCLCRQRCSERDYWKKSVRFQTHLSISLLYLFVDCITMVHGRCFSPSTLASSTTKTGRHDIAEVLLKVTLNTINHKSINLIFTDNIISLYSFKSNTAYRIKYLRKY